jgi:O-antigen/teichoic acid export membrane protein
VEVKDLLCRRTLLEKDMLQDVKRKIVQIRQKQKISLITTFAGFIVIFLAFTLGILFANSIILMFAYIGLFIFFISGCIWIYFSYRKNKIIKELKTRSGEQEDWELIQELLSE